MFTSIYNGKFKPFNEQKLRSLLSKEELKIVDEDLKSGIEFKLSVYIYVNNLDKSDFKCPCGNYVTFKTAKKQTPIKYCSKSCSTKYTAKERNNTKYKNFGGKTQYSKYVSAIQLKNSNGIPHQKISRSKAAKTLLEKYGVPHNSQLSTVKNSRIIFEDGKFKNVMTTNAAIKKATETRNSKSQREKDLIAKKISNSKKRNNDLDYSILENITEKSLSKHL